MSLSELGLSDLGLSDLGLSDLAFADPGLLVWLLPAWGLWVVARLLLPRLRRRSHPVLTFPDLARLRRLASPPASRGRRRVQALRLVSVGLLVLAMARPQSVRELTTVRTEGVDIVLALDASGSMRALDLDGDRPIRERRDRLEVARAVVEEFVVARPYDQIGLVVFGENAFTQCPLTLDHEIVRRLLERIEIGVAGDATAIGSALGTAVKRLRDAPATSKVVVLLTDGRNNAGPITPSQAAQLAATFGIRVYTVGVGTRGSAPFLIETPFGARMVHQDVELDEESLAEIAEITGGAHFRAEDAAALEEIYERIDRLEKSEIETSSFTEHEERFPWLVAPALGLLLLEVVLLGTRWRRLP